MEDYYSKIYVGQFNSPCVKTFSRLIACVHTYEICRSTNRMHLQSAQGHKVVPQDGNWCQNLFSLLVCIFLI